MPSVSSIPPIMRTFTVEVLTYGKIVIPSVIRQLLGIKKDDYVTLQLLDAIKPSGEPKDVKRIPAQARTFTVKVLNNYRVTIPARLRRELAIKPQDTVTLVVVEHRPASLFKQSLEGGADSGARSVEEGV